MPQWPRRVRRLATDWIPLAGIFYDPKNDLLAVVAEGVDHMVRRPSQIHIDHDLDWLHSVEAVDAEGNHHIILLKDPLPLPSP